MHFKFIVDVVISFQVWNRDNEQERGRVDFSFKGIWPTVAFFAWRCPLGFNQPDVRGKVESLSIDFTDTSNSPLPPSWPATISFGLVCAMSNCNVN